MNPVNFLVLKYVKENKSLVTISLFLSALAFTTDLIIAPYALSKLTSNIVKKKFKNINKYIYFAIIIYFSRIVINYMFKKTEENILANLIEKTRNYLYEKLIRKYSDNFTDVKVGDSYTRIHRTTLDMRDVIKIFITQVFPLFFVNVIIAIIFFSLEKKTGIVFIIAIILTLLLIKYWGPIIIKNRIETENLLFKQQDNANDTLLNLMNVYINNQEKQETNKLKKDQLEYKDSYLLGKNNQIIFGTSLSVVAILSTFFVLILMVKIVKNNKLTTDQIIYMMFLITFYLRNTFKLSRQIPYMYHYIGTTYTLTDFFNNIINYKNNNNKKLIQSGNISFKNIYFQYDSNSQVIKNLNLNIKNKEKIAIIGRSGSGKSTIMKLLIKLYPYKGTISIDNVNIKDIDTKYLREKILYINQKTGLHDDTIINNIKYGNDVTDTEIINYLKKYDLEIIFSSLNKGIYSNAGVNGNNLSLGMQKIILILRGLFKSKNAIAIIFDEPLAGLDINTRKKVMNILKDIKNKTIIIISHNKEILPFVDRTIDINKINK